KRHEIHASLLINRDQLSPTLSRFGGNVGPKINLTDPETLLVPGQYVPVNQEHKSSSRGRALISVFHICICNSHKWGLG
ncbi:MAG TPA: hypothetical protein VK638_49200, partial [Edaphobacter sp.]|nr:hypothetical protein [Edaphobacter sp.]